MPPITRDMVEEALDLFIATEPEGCSDTTYRRNKKLNHHKLELANKVIHEYGTQISPMTLEHMQDEFYSFTNSDKYRASAHICSIARIMLSVNWHHVGPWLH